MSGRSVREEVRRESVRCVFFLVKMNIVSSRNTHPHRSAHRPHPERRHFHTRRSTHGQRRDTRRTRAHYYTEHAGTDETNTNTRTRRERKRKKERKTTPTPPPPPHRLNRSIDDPSILSHPHTHTSSSSSHNDQSIYGPLAQRTCPVGTVREHDIARRTRE